MRRLLAVCPLVAVLVAGCGGATQPTYSVDFSARTADQAAVGSPSGLEVVVKDTGPDIPLLTIYLNSKDNWLDKNVVTDRGPCTIKIDLGRLECGPLRHGATFDHLFVASPKQAGNFNFQVDVVVATQGSGGDLAYPNNNSITWYEAITS